MVVYDHFHHRNVVPGGCCDLVHIHAETAVTRNVDDRLVPAPHLGSDGGAQAISHGPQAAGGEKGPWLAVVVILGRPHLVLSHLGDDHGISLGHLVDGLHNKGTGERVLVIAQGVHILHAFNMGDPLVMVNGIQPGVQLAQDHLHIADDAGIHLNILIDLSRVDIQLKDLGIPCKLGRIACHPVAEPGAHHDQQVGLCYAEIRSLCSMHAHHACIQFITPVKRPLAHETVRHRGLDLVCKCSQLI